MPRYMTRMTYISDDGDASTLLYLSDQKLSPEQMAWLQLADWGELEGLSEEEVLEQINQFLEWRNPNGPFYFDLQAALEDKDEALDIPAYVPVLEKSEYA